MTERDERQPRWPAGWYPDGQGATRWWDGQQWTEHVQQPQGGVTVNTGSGASVTFYRHETRHGLHLFLTIVTLGFWAPVWFVVWLWNRVGPERTSRTYGS